MIKIFVLNRGWIDRVEKQAQTAQLQLDDARMLWLERGVIR